MKKFKSNNLLAIVIVLFGVAALAGWYLLPQYWTSKNESEYDNLSNALKNHASEVAALDETHQFPIYPGARFIKKEDTLPCPTPLISGYTDCGSVAYRWGVNEDTEKVQYWYTGESIKNKGWEVLGGAGSMGDITKSSLRNLKDNFEVSLLILSHNTAEDRALYKTTVSVLIPK